MTSALRPAEARFILEVVGVPALRFEHVVTARVIAATPSEHVNYRPAVGARGAADLARHIVGTELRFLEGAATGSFPDLGPDLAAVIDMAALAKTYQAKFDALLEQLSSTTGEQLLRTLDYRGVIQLPALAFVQFAINHTIHHRGQLSVYLRAIGVGVPPIYG